MAVCGEKDVADRDFSSGGDNAISSPAEVLGRGRHGVNSSDRRVGLEIQGSGFDE